MSNLGFTNISSKLRDIFWPIRKRELSKFIPMSTLMFCILFNQNILRILKDSILISEVSAEITSFTKVYCLTPLAALFVIIYSLMLDRFSFDKIFYYLISFFTSFYFIFAFIIYPNVDFFHMDAEKLKLLMQQYPNFKWYIALIGNWSYVLFYAFSELWPNIFYLLLFWQIANEITSTTEAKRFYTMFSFFGNSSLIVVGLLMGNLTSDHSSLRDLLLISNDKITLTKVSVSLVIISSVLSCILVKYISHTILKGTELFLKPSNKIQEKNKMGIIESFKYIARSKYLWLMLICTASFGLSMNLIEAVWKSKASELYPQVTSYASFNAGYILWTGVTIMIMTIIGHNVMRNSSWFAAAVISPIIILTTGTMFFFVVVFDSQLMKFLDGVIIISPLVLAVSIGAIQNILSKGSKYSIWDTSRQMLYIPLDRELRTKGKAAVDIASPKIGKSASGIIQSIIFTIIPTATYHSIAPGLMIIFISVCVLWIYAVRKIYLEYRKLI